MSNTDQVAGARRALLIGIDGYLEVPALGGCVNDVAAVYTFLTMRAGFPRAQVHALLAPAAGTAGPAELAPAALPTKQNILDAFRALAEDSRPGDQVVVYYSGHGANIPNPAHPTEQIGAIVPYDADLKGRNFLLNRELNMLIKALARVATATVVLDACHSGGATRGGPADGAAGNPTVREIVLAPEEIAPETWATLAGTAPPQAAPQESPEHGGWEHQAGSGWALAPQPLDDLIVVAGCRAVETAQEFAAPGQPRHGALTLCLLDALQTIGAGEVGSTTWQDLYPVVRQRVQAVFPTQTPVLEGRVERPVFGGAWQPYAPGFTVTVAGATMTVNGGVLHGLDEGAALAIYPPDTADFAQADAAGTRSIRALVTGRSTPVQSTIQVDAGSAPVATGSRARLARPSASTPLLSVALPDLPAETQAALAAVPGAAEFLTLAPGTGPTVEVRRWTMPGAPARWVIVHYTWAEPHLTWNDVIAWAPDVAVLRSGDPAESAAEQESAARRVLGIALGAGLIHWAKYWATLNRRNEDARLRGTLTLTLEVGSGPAPAWEDATAWREVPPAEAAQGSLVAGQYDGAGTLLGGTLLRLRVGVKPNAPAPLSVGVLLCSNDGNIALVWPPPSPNPDNEIAPGHDRRVGFDGPAPFTLSVDRRDQTAGLYTFKAFAAVEALPVDLTSLELPRTVQEVVDAQIGTKGVAHPDPLPQGDLLWTTVELPVRVRKDLRA